MRNYNLRFALILLLFLTFYGCKKIRPEHIVNTIGFIGHTRTDPQDAGPITSDLDGIDFEQFDIMVHGGDIAFETANDSVLFQWLIERFSFKKHSNYLAYGNHEMDNIENWVKHSGIPREYSELIGDVFIIVYDTQLDECNISSELLENVDRAVSNTNIKHVFVFTHKLIWMVDNDDLEPLVDKIPNAGKGPFIQNLQKNNFYSDLYPKLLKFKSMGSQVYCIAGDVGKIVRKFTYVDDQSVHFIASGMAEYKPDNTILLFERKKDTFSYDFVATKHFK